jgi:uncharacterized protein (TIGR03437 family)
VSPNQVNFQVPFQVPSSGTARVVVTAAAGVSNTSTSATLAEFAPGVFRVSGDQPIVLHSDYSFVTANAPAHANEILILYGTGIGGLNNPPPTGAAAVSQPLATALVEPTITVAGLLARVLFTGLAPGFVGLVQINFQMPAIPRGGPNEPLVLAYGALSDMVGIPVTP